jgi:hypothetical protein
MIKIKIDHIFTISEHIKQKKRRVWRTLVGCSKGAEVGCSKGAWVILAG